MTDKQIKKKIEELTPVIDKHVKMYFYNSIKEDDTYELREWYIDKDEYNLNINLQFNNPKIAIWYSFYNEWSNGRLCWCIQPYLNDLLKWSEIHNWKEDWLVDGKKQYASIEDAKKGFADEYSNNKVSDLLLSLPLEQRLELQKIWHKEIKMAVMSGIEYGIELANDERYK